MSKVLLEYMPVLKAIAAIKSASVRKDVLKQFSDDQKLYKALREIAKNIKAKKLNLNEKQKRKLNKDKHLILSLIKKGNKGTKRRKLIIQSGKGLFLPIAIPLVVSLIESVIRKYGTRQNDDANSN